MEEIVEIIKKNLTGNYEEDIEFLNSLYEEENKIIENANATIEAINIVVKEVETSKEQLVEDNEDEVEDKVEENLEEIDEEEQVDQSEEEKQIDGMINELFKRIDDEDSDDLLPRIENIITRIESLTDSSNENEIHCSFSNEMERLIFEKIFATDKEIVITPYKNDVLYILYADILLEKKRKSAALEALNRAIYWNFLNREAREKKLEILHSKNQIVKYLENLKVLQQISYTAEDLAHVYNLYGKIFDELRDKEAAYGVYKLSNFYYPDKEIEEIVYTYEDANPDYKNITEEELLNHIRENEVQIGPNPKIIKAHRDITTEFLNAGRLDDAQVLLENDYSLTRDGQIAIVYNQLLEVKEKKEQQEAEVSKKKRTTKKKKKDDLIKEEKKTNKTAKKAKTTNKENEEKASKKSTKKATAKDEEKKKDAKKTATKKKTK